MPELSRRTQILLDESRYERLRDESQVRGASIAELIREAIDRTYPATTAQRRRAAADFLGEAASSPLDPIAPAQLKEEILSGSDPDPPARSGF